MVATRARVCRGNQREAGWIDGCALCSGQAHFAILEWAAKELESASIEFGNFIQEQHAIVCERDFAWLESCISHESSITDGVVGASEWSLRCESGTCGMDSRHGMYPCHFDGFSYRYRWQNGGHA